jgi:peptide/nickel transport system ATP-binding protein
VSALLEIKDLHVDIPGAAGVLRALRGVSLSVEEGEAFALVGESGCGKSLTAMAALGLLPRAARMRAASLRLEGRDLTRLSQRQWNALRATRVAAIFQEPMTALNPVLTVGRQMTEAYVRHGLGDGAAARRRAAELLERVGVVPVDTRLAQYPHQMSGGLRQRVMIAMALMCHPRLMIADEPTTALDVTTQVEILKLLQELRRDTGMALLLITHDLGVVAHVAERVAVMYAGEVVETGPVAQVVTRPDHPYTAALLRCLPVQATRDLPLVPIPGVVPALFGTLEGCSFRNRCTLAGPDCAGTIPWRGAGQAQGYRCLRDRAAG